MDGNESIILKVENLTKRFGDFLALSKVSLSVRKKELTALIGPNGAGKTTFYNVISGRYKPSSGHVYFEGKEISGLPPYKIARLGLGRSFQINNLFNNLSVEENFLAALASYHNKGRHLFRSLGKENFIIKRAHALMDLLGLTPHAKQPVSHLAYGEKRLIEIGLAIAHSPRLILLDEPTAGMTPEETDKMIELIKRLSNELDTTFFLTEHDMKVVFSISQRIFVLHQGSLLASGTADEIKNNKAVKEAYLGGSMDA